MASNWILRWVFGVICMGMGPVEVIGDTPAGWRTERRLIDVHMHIEARPERFERALRIMDAVGIGVGVNLSGGTTTAEGGGESEFRRVKAMADRVAPGRFVHYMNLDYRGWDEPDFSERAVRQVEEGHRLGAAGLKEYKRLGLGLKDGAGRLIKVDDAKLDPVWRRCGELGMPVSIHVGDPKAFWLPLNDQNERWTELKDHPGWWFGDAQRFPSREALLEALDRVIGRHPGTTFVGVHFANNPEDLEWVEGALDRRPNMMADIAARVPEIGRRPAESVRRLFMKHQDRILFGTDFMVYDRLILGSGGSGPGPTDEDALEFFGKHWRWFETEDRQFEHMTPIQGDWKIDAIGLPSAALRKVYFDNARRLLVRSLPLPVLKASRIGDDFELTGRLEGAAWGRTGVARLEYTLREGEARPGLATEARALWSAGHLYLGFRGPFTELTVFDPPLQEGERRGLWDRDVVEAFIGTDPGRTDRYTEYEVAPTNERLDLLIEEGQGTLEWGSGFTSASHVDRSARVWTVEMKIPMKALVAGVPEVGTRWRLNLYRHDRAGKAFLAWSPTGTGTAHTPGRFGVLELVGD